MSVQPDNQAPRSSDLGPLPLFDFHLRVLSESYLAFFQERKRIEEIYYESLTKLHKRARQLDAYYDERLASTTLRSAWAEIRDNLEREAQTRRAFLDTVNSDVLNPLIALRETQDRIRKRIKEDMKDSILTHTDFAENDLPKLKRAYIKKCQDVEDYKAAATAAAAQAQSPRLDNSAALSASRSNPGVPSRPVVTSPQPLRPLDRRPSSSSTSTRARSPSTTTTFSDFAQQGKKQLNQLITFLDKGGAKEVLGGRPESNALRSVRAKREADEADTMYRRGVHWLETLRIRREKIVEAGYQSLETFLRETSETVKKVIEKYTDNLAATLATSCQLCSHGRAQVDSILTSKDMKTVSASIPQYLASALPKPVLYYNFFVGECRDLIFGFSLVDYATARNLSDGKIPRIVRLCIEEVDKRGLDLEGIYRVSGRLASVIDLMHKIERNEQAFSFNPIMDDIFVISTLLKLYLRDLPEPLFKFPLQERIQHSDDIKAHIANDFQLLRSKIRRLPAIHRNTLKAVTLHLNRVASHREKNKMDVKNLAIVFGIFGNEDELPKGGDLLSVQAVNDTLMVDLITYAHTLFDDRHPSPPLPPAPSDEPVPQLSYGSQHTKISELTLDDFTPKLPPRPPQSIHPSSRVNGSSLSPVKSDFDISFPQQPPLKPGRQGVALSIPPLKSVDNLDFEPLSYHGTDITTSSDQIVASGSISLTAVSDLETPLSSPPPLPKSFSSSDDPTNLNDGDREIPKTGDGAASELVSGQADDHR